MTAGSSCGTSEMNSARARRPRSCAVSRPPLSAESARRRAVEFPDGDALGETGAVQRLQLAQGVAGTEHFHQTRGPAGDEEQRLRLRRQPSHPPEQARAGRE